MQVEPEKPEVEVEVELPVVRNYSEQDRKALESLGVYEVQMSHFAGIALVGRLAREYGIIDMIKGGTMMSQEALITIQQKCMEIINDETGKYKPKFKHDIMKTVGYIANTLARVNLSVVKVDATVAVAVDMTDQVRRRSWAPGMAVKAPKPAKVVEV